jgi:hypothetical protein
LSGKSRRQLVRISEQMKRWSALLEAEIATWPAVTWRPMFGMTVAYRKGAVFAALPRTRAFETSRSVAFKLYKETSKVRTMLESDSRITTKTVKPHGSWIPLELSGDNDLAGALKWFELAYRTCLPMDRRDRTGSSK